MSDNYLYSHAILGTHLYLPIDELRTPVSKLRHKLVAKPNYPELASVNMFDESREGYFGIPRYYGIDLSKIKKLEYEISEGLECEHVFTSELWANQAPLFEEFVDLVESGHTGIIIKAATASGKTVLLLKFLSYLKRNALIIVPSTAVFKQWVNKICEHTAYSSDDIGTAQADICDYKDKPITVGMIHSVCKDKYGADFNNHFGVVIIDEIDRTGAEHFSRVVSLFSAKYRLGASAEIKRPDGMHIVFHNHMKGALITLDGDREEDLRPKILVHGYTGAGVNVPFWAEDIPKTNRRGVILSAIAKDKNRSDLLLSKIIQVAMSGRRILVLSDRTKQLKYLYKNTDSVHNAGLYIEETSDKDRKSIIENSSIIYSSYRMLSIGTDIPDLAGLVLATPQSRIKQAVGRILRSCEGKKRPIVIDVVDSDIRDCVIWFYSRQREYKHADIKGEIVIVP